MIECELFWFRERSTNNTGRGWVDENTVSGQFHIRRVTCPVTRDIQRALSHYRDNRPCFYRCDRLTDRRVFLHVDWSIDGSVPNRRLVGPVDHVYLDLYCSRQHRVSSVLGDGLQPVALSLEDKNQGQRLVENVEIDQQIIALKKLHFIDNR